MFVFARGLLLAALGFASFAAPAHAGNDFEYYEDGADVVLGASHFGDPATQITLSRCEADACTPLAGTSKPDARGVSVVARVTGAPAGSTFEAVVETPGQPAERFRTPVWNGPQTVRTAPALVGEAKVGGTVEIVPGSTSGGFADVDRSPSLYACAEAASGPCYVIAHPKFSCLPLLRSMREACAGRLSATLEPRWAGWHLIASEGWSSGRRLAVEVLVWHVPPWGPYEFPQPNTRVGLSAPLGPIAPAPATPEAPPVVQLRAATDTTPKVTLRRRALRRDGRLRLGQVTCPVRCTVKLTVNGRSRTFRVTGTRTLTTPIRKGRLKVRVAVDGQRLASATLRR